jgi:hypothetical protein
MLENLVKLAAGASFPPSPSPIRVYLYRRTDEMSAVKMLAVVLIVAGVILLFVRK